MARNGSGTYVPPTNSWSPAVNGTLATTADWQSLLNDMVAALTQSVSKDGQTVMTGSLNMGGFNLSNVASAAISAITGSPTIASPTLTGTPLSVTAAPGTNNTQIATTAFVATSFAPINSPTFTGTVTIPSGASIADYATLLSPALTGTPTAPTAVVGTNTTQIATTAFVTATSFVSALPGQAGNAGKFVTTDGTNASWADAVTPTGTQTLTNKTIRQTVSEISGNTNATTGVQYVFTASLTLTLPASPTVGDVVSFANNSGTSTCVIGRNGSNIMSLAENLTIDATTAPIDLMYASASRGWVFI